MEKAAIGIAETLARLSAATIFELRGEWRRLHRAPPPMRLSRDLLLRGITYKLQERPLGGLSKTILRKLEGLNLESEASRTHKPPGPNFVEGGDAAYTRMARCESYRACPGARVRMERPALPVPHHHRP
jgi:Protein of unknown function (DUF2924)